MTPIVTPKPSGGLYARYLAEKQSTTQPIIPAKIPEKKSFWEPTPQVRLRDVLREIPGTVKEFGKTILQAPGRAAGSVLLSTTGQKEFQPETKLEQLALGKEPIKSLEERTKEARETLERLGFSEQAAKFTAPVGVLGLTALDLYPGSAGKGKLVKQLAEETSEVAIKTLLKKNVKNLADDAIETLAPQLAKTKNIKEVESLLSGAVKPVTSVANPLLTEAKKYKTAEEFVKAQGTPVYHGSPYAKKIETEGFKLGKNENLVNAFGRGSYLSTSKKGASAYAGLPEKGGGVVEAYLPKDVKLKTVFDKDAYNIKAEKLIKEGYNGVVTDTFSGKHITVFDPSIIKTKSQLTAIWEKANKVSDLVEPRNISEIPLERPPLESGKIPQIDEELSSIQKVTQALKESKPIRGKQEAIYSAERSQRMAKAVSVGKKTTGEAGFYGELGQLKGEMPKVQFESLRGKIGQGDIDNLFNQVKGSQVLNFWDKVTARGGLVKLFEGRVPTEGELTLLGRVFPKEFIETILSKRSLWTKFKEAGYQLANIPRSVMASFDLSAPFRQGLFLISHPKKFFGSFAGMIKAFGGEKSFKAIQEGIVRKPTFDLMQEGKLALTEMDAILTAREERFMSSWAEKIPVVGKVIRASGRAYTGFLNKLRADVFEDLITKADTLGLTPRSNPDLVKEIANFVNVASGRGSLGGLQPAANALNSFFFSPRLMASRLTLLNPVYYVKASPFVRKEALKSLLVFGGITTSILGLAKLAGAEVGIDPRSADFGKIKLGDTRIDIMGGFQQYIRMMAQLITGKYISTTTNKEITLGEGYKPLTRLDILMRQVESKEAPIFSFITDLMRGQDYQGNPIKITKEIGNRFVPMFVSDIVDIAKDDPSLLPVGLLGGLGFGIQTYTPQIEFSPIIKTEVKRLQKIGFGQTSGLAGYMPEYEGLNPKQNAELQKRAEELVNDKIEKLLEVKGYQSLSDELKAKKIDQFVDKSKLMARVSLTIELTQGLEGEELKAKLSELKESGFLTKEVFNNYLKLR